MYCVLNSGSCLILLPVVATSASPVIYAPAKSKGFLSPAFTAVFTAARPVTTPTGLITLPVVLAIVPKAFFNFENDLLIVVDL